MRVGIGYDVHRLADDRDLIICGVKIPHTQGLAGHSDADVCAHAIMDALLGAAGLGDIGQHFPDTEEAYKGADSMKLMEYVAKLLDEKGFVISNVDATIIAQKPKLAPYREQMRENVAKALGLQPERINIKATTEEKLGFTGRCEGISSQAIALLQELSDFAPCASEGGCPGCGQNL